jgi:hypothetical protein
MTTLHVGRLSVEVTDTGLRRVMLGNVEVLRGLTWPVRDADWGTVPVRAVKESLTDTQYQVQFAALSGAFEGVLSVSASDDGAAARLTAELRMTAHGDQTTNRAGFCLLHPVRGVAGTALRIGHPDDRETQGSFPALIQPDQPARDIARMSHQVGPVAVEVALAGEVFEMEDQRNWSDASFKTYCRPLALPRPYLWASGEEVAQTVTLMLRETGEGAVPARAASGAARMPAVMLAVEDGLSPPFALAAFPGVGALWRVDGPAGISGTAALAGRKLAVEIVFDDLAGLSATLAALRAAGVAPDRIAALPRPWLKSHQPEGPWPAPPLPADAIPMLRAAFPQALVGGGSLTNFTELNRWRPEPATIDFLTFGSSAIVHAADDRSVIETLEAWPDILASTRALAAGRPLHLGLCAIAMRSNPYGAGVAHNPGRQRITMAQDDPRQETTFAAAWAVALLAEMAAGGVESVALAMPDGPLGAAGRPIGRVIRAAAAMAGQAVEVRHAGGIVTLEAGPMRVSAALAHGGRLTGKGLHLRADDGHPVAATDPVLSPFDLFLEGFPE